MRMYRDKPGTGLSTVIVRLVAILLMVAMLIVICLRVGSGITDDMRENATDSIREAVMDSALQCYAVEGAYPPSIAYLQENYGLQVNTDDYEISYNVFASNIAPSVQVYSRKGES